MTLRATQSDLDLDAWLPASHDGPTGSHYLPLGRKGKVAPQCHWGITREGPQPPLRSLVILTHSLRSQDFLGKRTIPATVHMSKRSAIRSSENTELHALVAMHGPLEDCGRTTANYRTGQMNLCEFLIYGLWPTTFEYTQ